MELFTLPFEEVLNCPFYEFINRSFRREFQISLFRERFESHVAFLPGSHYSFW